MSFNMILNCVRWSLHVQFTKAKKRINLRESYIEIRWNGMFGAEKNLISKWETETMENVWAEMKNSIDHDTQ